MAFVVFARRLQRRTHLSNLLLSLVLRPVINYPPSPPSEPIHTLFEAFHQTPLCISYFSARRPFSTKNLYDPIDFTKPHFQTRDSLNRRLLELLDQLADFPSEIEAIAALDESGIEASPELVHSAIWALREKWRVAFLVFKWGDRWGCSDEHACNLMVWVLGSRKKFKTAWCLIRDLHRRSRHTRKTMLIMIDRYVAGNSPCNAIKTFRIMEKFRMTPDDEGAMHTLLSALCKYGYIEEAEEFMLVNKKFFPLGIESFNIILNGWCNISVDLLEAKRVWRKLSEYCITPDATSYSHMISCFSKVGNLFDSLRLYDEMKKRGWVPSTEVYNSLIYVLTLENCFKEALKILDNMKERGLKSNSDTFNSMICPLCEANKLEEARMVLTAMMEENLSPTVETYDSFLEGESYEGTLEVLSRMKQADLGPGGDTMLRILGKYLKLKQPENALKIWDVMKRYEVVPDSTHYTMLIQGLAASRLFAKAKEFYAEMKSHGFLEDPKLKMLLKKPGKRNGMKRRCKVRSVKRDRRKGSGMRLKSQRMRSRKKRS